MTFILVTSPDHVARGRVGRVTHAAKIAGASVLVAEFSDGKTYYVREQQYKIVKSGKAT